MLVLPELKQNNKQTNNNKQHVITNEESLFSIGYVCGIPC